MNKSMTRRKRNYPHGIAIDPDQIKSDIVPSPPGGSGSMAVSSGNPTHQVGSVDMSDLFVTMCFFARLGFVQPPACLKCAYRSSGCGENNRNNDSNEKKQQEGGDNSNGASSASSSSCRELVAWRTDASIPLHPDKLEGNIVFVTCDTAKSLVNGDAYPSIRWDSRNRRLLHEM